MRQVSFFWTIMSYWQNCKTANWQNAQTAFIGTEPQEDSRVQPSHTVCKAFPRSTGWEASWRSVQDFISLELSQSRSSVQGSGFSLCRRVSSGKGKTLFPHFKACMSSTHWGIVITVRNIIRKKNRVTWPHWLTTQKNQIDGPCQSTYSFDKLSK